MNRRSSGQLGLTLFELLIVLAILAFIAALVAPRVVGYLGRAKGDIARTQASNLAASLELFFLDLERYPTAEEGLAALVSAPPDQARWRGPYLKDPAGLIDPWGRPYLYEVDEATSAFAVVSYGRDGAEGGDGEDDDIRKN
ncbi:MAG TPA: type II secretion system protein GspG [Parvularcula sp.]|nr:type II secretion system protein GspG [Parvularcula sp.]HBS36005.1 type II secretion system protein GspG [Parvularcula sp.]